MQLSDPSALLLRNIAYFQNQKCLLVNGSGDQLPSYLIAEQAQVFTFNTHFGNFQNYQAQAHT